MLTLLYEGDSAITAGKTMIRVITDGSWQKRYGRNSGTTAPSTASTREGALRRPPLRAVPDLHLGDTFFQLLVSSRCRSRLSRRHYFDHLGTPGEAPPPPRALVLRPSSTRPWLSESARVDARTLRTRFALLPCFLC